MGARGRRQALTPAVARSGEIGVSPRPRGKSAISLPAMLGRRPMAALSKTTGLAKPWRPWSARGSKCRC